MKRKTKRSTDEANIVPYGLKCTFGGDRSTGFALIYDN